jgi:hypothetical protein
MICINSKNNPKLANNSFSDYSQYRIENEKNIISHNLENRVTEKIAGLFLCKYCGKIYLSYSACYTHERNKHSLIPMTRSKIKKSLQRFQSKEIKLKIRNASSNSIYIYEELLSLARQVEKMLYLTPNYYLYTDDMGENDSNLFWMSEYYSLILKSHYFKKKLSSSLCVPELLFIFSIDFACIFNEDNIRIVIIKFAYSFVDFLNIAGYGVIKGEIENELIPRRKEYFSFCRTYKVLDLDIPDLVTEYYS